MNVLPRMLFLFQTLPILSTDLPFKEWQKDISKFIWQGKKPRIKYKLLQDAKERGGLGLPNLKLYFDACCLLWMKEWITLENKKLLQLEGHELRFGWHAYLWYDKVKVNKDFKNHFIRNAILRIWNKYKVRLSPNIPLWLSPQEAIGRRENVGGTSWLKYKDLLKFEVGEPKIKTREMLEREGYICHWFTYIQLVEHFKLDKKNYKFVNETTQFEMDLCINNDHVITKMYKILLQMNMEDEQVKDCMIKWAKNFGYNIMLEQWENMWTKGLKFTLNYNLKENFYKMMYRWYLTPDKLSEMYNGVTNVCWKCLQGEGTFFHLWWTCEKAKKFWDQICIIIQKILKVNIQRKPELFLLGLMEKELEKQHGVLLLYMITAARLLYAQRWKDPQIPTIEDWIVKLMDLAQMAKLTALIREHSISTFLLIWQPLLEYLLVSEKNEVLYMGFGD